MILAELLPFSTHLALDDIPLAKMAATFTISISRVVNNNTKLSK
jgi:hypothetical protein